MEIWTLGKKCWQKREIYCESPLTLMIFAAITDMLNRAPDRVTMPVFWIVFSAEEAKEFEKAGKLLTLRDPAANFVEAALRLVWQSWTIPMVTTWLDEDQNKPIGDMDFSKARLAVKVGEVR